MDKVIRDGKVAVLYSPGFGAGWSTWNREIAPECIFDPGLVACVEKGEGAHAYAQEKWPEAYCGGVSDLAIEWVPVGTAFRINEYDGSEHVEIYTPDSFYVA